MVDEKALTILECAAAYPPEGHPRRDNDGYPTEFVYDEFAYRRIVDSYRDAIKRAVALLKGPALSPGSSGETEGWVLVPREPTEAMVIAGLREGDALGELIDWRGPSASLRMIGAS